MIARVVEAVLRAIAEFRFKRQVKRGHLRRHGR